MGAECDSDQKIFIAKFRLKLKKVGKTTRALRYDLNQIVCVYAVEVVNTKIRLIILFVAEDGEALYSQKTLDQELTMAQFMNFLLPNSE